MAINASKYDAKKWVYVGVELGTLTGIKYGFRTHIPDAIGTKFGHAAIPKGTDLLIIGANYPKPARAFGNLTSGAYVSSFVGSDKVADAKADGYVIQRSRARAIFGQGSNSYVVKTEVYGMDYAWKTPEATWGMIIDAGANTGLKVSLVTTQTEGEKCVVGTSFPKPAKYKMSLGDKVITSYCDPTASVAKGGDIKSWAITTKALQVPYQYSQDL